LHEVILMEPTTAAYRFWKVFCAAHDVEVAAPHQAFFFGMDETLANPLAALVARGKKRATAGLLIDELAEPQEADRIGDYGIVTTFAGEPVAVTRCIALHLFKFRDVPAWFAEREGENEGQGEECLAGWKADHRHFFEQRCALLGISFSESLEVVCNSFDILHVNPHWKELLKHHAS
jgi:uncharacterized protein YhfF